MYRHILIGVDGGPHGRDAIALARRLADPSAELCLVHVYGGEGISDRVPTAESAAQRAAAMELLECERSAAGVQAELKSVAAASVGRGLYELATSRPTDLIVLGSTQYGPGGRALVGDDTRAALASAPCVVAIAPRGYRRGTRRIGLVGITYDFSDAADSVLCVAWQLACEHAAPLTALYVAPSPTPEGDKVGADPLEHLEGRIAYGELGSKLAAFSTDVDLLIVGSRERGALRRLIFGSTVDYLADRADCALLILPRPSEETL